MFANESINNPNAKALKHELFETVIKNKSQMQVKHTSELKESVDNNKK